MKTRLLIIGIVVIAITASTLATIVINEMALVDTLIYNNPFSNTCPLIRGENDTFYVIGEDCRFEAFKPIKPVASFYSLDVTQKLHEATKIREACIPVSGFDVDETPRTLMIYFTKENALEHATSINNTIDMPYIIKITERPAIDPDSWRNARCFIQNLFDKN